MGLFVSHCSQCFHISLLVFIMQNNLCAEIKDTANTTADMKSTCFWDEVCTPEWLKRLRGTRSLKSSFIIRKASLCFGNLCKTDHLTGSCVQSFRWVNNQQIFNDFVVDFLSLLTHWMCQVFIDLVKYHWSSAALLCVCCISYIFYWSLSTVPLILFWTEVGVKGDVKSLSVWEQTETEACLLYLTEVLWASYKAKLCWTWFVVQPSG